MGDDVLIIMASLSNTRLTWSKTYRQALLKWKQSSTNDVEEDKVMVEPALPKGMRQTPQNPSDGL